MVDVEKHPVANVFNWHRRPEVFQHGVVIKKKGDTKWYFESRGDDKNNGRKELTY